MHLSMLSPYKIQYSANPGLLKVVVWFIALIIAILTGMTLASGIYQISLALLILMTGLMLMVYPVFGIWVIIIGALVFAGLIDLYIPILRPLTWGLGLLSISIGGITLLKEFFKPRRKKIATKESNSLFIWAFLFVICVIFSSLVNWQGVSNFAVGLKGYLQVWGLLIAIYYLTKSALDAHRFILFFLLLGILQLPFVFHQLLVLVPLRTKEIFAEKGIVAGDIVAGTFGGIMTGGGRSSDLALLCVICITIVLAQWRADQKKTSHAVWATLFYLLPMFVSEAKSFLVLLPIALFLLFSDRIRRNPFKAIFGTVALSGLMMAIFFAYSLLPGAKSQQSSSLQAMWQQNIDYNIGSRGYGNLELNRSTVYSFWLKEQVNGDMLAPVLIGDGPGSTNSGNAFNTNTQANTRYQGYGIGLTGLSSLLWEVGLIGTIVLVAMFVSAFRLGGRLAEKWQGTIHWPTLKTAQIAIPLLGFNLLHNNYFVFDICFQTMMIVILGYLLVMTRFEKDHI